MIFLIIMKEEHVYMMSLYCMFHFPITFGKSFVFRGSSLWNNLSPVERNIPTFDGFKDMLKVKLDHKLI